MHEGAPGWRLGSIARVPVFLSKSWLIIAAVIVAMFGPQLHAIRPDWGTLAYVVAFGYALTMLFSVLVHEVSHALAARGMGMRPQHIVLDLFGGHTQFHADNIRPASSFVVAFAGPLSNLALAGLSWLVLGQLDPYGVAARLLYGLMWTNTFVGLFNLLPGLPLDGGAMVEAAIWGVTGRRSLGTRIAAYLGMAVAIGSVLYFLRGFITGNPPSTFSVVWSLMIGQMLWSGSRGALHNASVRERADRVDVKRLVHPVRSVGSDQPVSALMGRMEPVVVVDPATGTPVAVVDLQAAGTALAAGRPAASILSVARGITDQDLVSEGSDAMTVLTRLAASPADQLIVTRDGRAVGVLPVGHLLEALQRP